MLIKTAIRSLKRNKAFSVINILGLALGMAVFLLILEFIASSWNANRFHKNYNRLYRAASESREGISYYHPPGYAGVLVQQFPQIESVVRIAEGVGGGVLQVGEGQSQKRFRENNIWYVERNFLNVFSFPLVSKGASLESNQLAVSRSLAMKLFGTVDAAGKSLYVDNQFGKTLYTVAAVMENTPDESDLGADLYLSIHTLESQANRNGNDWADPNATGSGSFTSIFLLLRPDAEAQSLSNSIAGLLRGANGGDDVKIFLQPMKHLHLAPSFTYPYQTYGSRTFVVLLFSVALLILIIGWVNYINLSTVQYLRRVRESAVRKVLGASRTAIAQQFLVESLLVTVISFIGAMAIVQMLQPVFNSFTGKNLSLSRLNDPWFWLLALGVIALGSLLSGGYVSWSMSGRKPVFALKGQWESSRSGISLRKGLVVFQFCISVVFIIVTLIMYKQLNFMRTEDLGMKLDQLLVLQGPTNSGGGQASRNLTFKQQLRALPFAKDVAASNNVPGSGFNFTANGITRLVPAPGDDQKGYQMFIADENFFKTYGIQLLEGNYFTEKDAADGWEGAEKLILNQSAAAQLGFAPDERIAGKKILWGKPYEVIGVVKDYHHLSLKEPIGPMIFLPSVSFSNFTVRLDAADLPNKIRTINKLYASTFPGEPFEYFFADEAFSKQYKQDQDLGRIFFSSTLVAILIACMGLFGLAAFSAQQRVKEIGVRKVLGAGVGQITRMLSWDFVKLVMIAIVIGTPVAAWAMNKWLQEFPYRTGLDWWLFLSAGLLAVIIAVGTVSFHAVRAARANPVKSLRNE